MECEIAKNNVEKVEINTFENGVELGFEKVIQSLRSKDAELPLGHYRYAWEWANWLKDRKEDVLK